jgi:hypothetical protein
MSVDSGLLFPAHGSTLVNPSQLVQNAALLLVYFDNFGLGLQICNLHQTDENSSPLIVKKSFIHEGRRDVFQHDLCATML